LGSFSVPPIYRAPYLDYEQCIRKNLKQNHDVLELGAGIGLHTFALVQTGARVVVSDISVRSLVVLSRRFHNDRVKTLVADMESLPFDANTFDIVTSAGSLSYGDPVLVNAEIKRVLKRGGMFLCVDSLNHNPIYRLNRWIHYMKGNRTKSTLLQMPTLKRIQQLSKMFENSDVRYFGSASYLMPLLIRALGQTRAAEMSDRIDRLLRVRRSAFKFVLVASGRL
jgi:ubiquinone/menaquinone biosynthesis C-methylase UbiE